MTEQEYTLRRDRLHDRARELREELEQTEAESRRLFIEWTKQQRGDVTQ